MSREKIILTGLMMALLGGCDKEKAGCSQEEPLIQDSVTLVASIGGSGDNGYNDLVLAGVIRFYNRHDDMKVSLLHPADIKEAAGIYEQWYDATSGQKEKSMIIFASDDYARLISDFSKPLDANQRALFFESHEDDLPENTTTLHISRYGVSYLAGAMAAESEEAHIVAAFESGGIISDAITGFRDGYLETGGKNAVVDYLAKDPAGYSMPNKAYELVANIDQAFIYPLAGGSNNGIYKYSRDDMFSLQLVAGMDVDCSEYSTRVPFSVLVHIDRVISDLLEQWHTTGELPNHIDYTLRDKDAIELSTNPHFFERAHIFEEYYFKDGYWEDRYERYWETACQKEKLYYEK